MKLYYAPAACSLAPHILLRETGLPFSLEKVDTARQRTADGRDYRQINPTGLVPLLETAEGWRLAEGPVIAQYIADQAGATTLMPAAGTPERYRVMSWQNYVSTELHKSFTPLFHAGLDEQAKATLRTNLRAKLTWLDGQLGAAGPYLCGADFTAADAYLFVVLNWARFVQLEIGDLAHLQALLRRVGERPAVRAALAAEGLAN